MNPEIDVIIVGAGAGGSALAAYLSEFNLKITCLEQGDFQDTQNYPSTKSGWEISKWSDFSPNPNVRKKPEDYPINCDESPISAANYNAVGGSTILFSGHFPRFHPSDFKVHSQDGIAEDWPISYSELEPFYNLSTKYTAVSGLAGDPAYPEIKNLLPPVPIGKMGESLAKGFNNLNWHWWPSYSAIATKKFAHHNKCINLGPCNLGCPQKAKSSADVAFWPIAIKNGVELKTRSRVEKILVNENCQAIGVSYFNNKNERVALFAKVVVLACNGIGTPRILLNSKSANYPNGVGNGTDMVGRNLMLHPLGYVEGVFTEDLDSNAGPQGCCIASHEFVETNRDRGFLRGFSMQILRGPGLLEAARSALSQGELHWGASHHEYLLENYSRTAHLSIICEDLPDINNRVVLDTNLKDSNGIPAPKIFYKLSENTKRIMAFGLKRGIQLMNASGAIRTKAYGPVTESGWHLMGTAKMGHDPRTSVVNKFGEVHDCSNLFIADSSIFVTSSSVNPAATIQALAMYIGNTIKNKLLS